MTLFRKELQKAPRWFINQLQASCVVCEGDVRKFYFLCRILKTESIESASRIIQLLYRLLFYFEDIVVEEHVKFFVGVVYAKLLKGICGKVFKSEDIQDANKLCHIFP